MAFKTTATEYLKHSNNNNNSNNNSNSSRIEKKKEIYEGDGGYSHPSIIFAFVTKLLSWAPVYFCLAIQWHDYVLAKSFLVCGRMASAVGLSISFVSCNKRPWTVRSWNMKMTGFLAIGINFHVQNQLHSIAGKMSRRKSESLFGNFFLMAHVCL